MMTGSPPHLVRLGTVYGGWTVPRDLLEPGFRCYCVGAGEDISFEEELISNYQCEVHSFDPTPRAIAHADNQKEIVPALNFHPIGVWSDNERKQFFAPRDPRHVSHSIVNIQDTADSFEADCKTVAAVMDELGHDSIGLLKLDIEGAEHAVIGQMLIDGVRPDVICVEMERPVRFAQFRKTVRDVVKAGYELVADVEFDLTFVRQDVARRLVQ